MPRGNISRPHLAYCHRGNSPAASVVVIRDYLVTAVSLSDGTPLTVYFEVWECRSQTLVQRHRVALDKIYGANVVASQGVNPLRLWPGGILTWHRHMFELDLRENGSLLIKRHFEPESEEIIAVCVFEDHIIRLASKWVIPVGKPKTKITQGVAKSMHADRFLYVCTDRQVLIFQFSGNQLMVKKTIPFADMKHLKGGNTSLKLQGTRVLYPYSAGKVTENKGFFSQPYMSIKEFTTLEPPKVKERGFLSWFEAPEDWTGTRVLYLERPVQEIALFRGLLLVAMERSLLIISEMKVLRQVVVPGIGAGFVIAGDYAITLPDMWVDVEALVSKLQCPTFQSAQLADNAVYFVSKNHLMVDRRMGAKKVLDDVIRILDIQFPQFLLAQSKSTLLWNIDTDEKRTFSLATMGTFLMDDQIVLIHKLDDSGPPLPGMPEVGSATASFSAPNLETPLDSTLSLILSSEHETVKKVDCEVLALVASNKRDRLYGVTIDALVDVPYHATTSGVSSINHALSFEFNTVHSYECHLWNESMLVLGFTRAIICLQESVVPQPPSNTSQHSQQQQQQQYSFTMVFHFDIIRCYSLGLGFGRVFASTPTGIVEIPIHHASSGGGGANTSLRLVSRTATPPLVLEKPMGILALKTDRVILVEKKAVRHIMTRFSITKRRIRYSPMTPSMEHFTDSRTVWPHAEVPWRHFACLQAAPQLRYWAEAAERENDTFRAVAYMTVALTSGERRRLSLNLPEGMGRFKMEDNLRKLIIEDQRDSIRSLLSMTIASANRRHPETGEYVALAVVYQTLSKFLLIKEYPERFDRKVQPACDLDVEALSQCSYWPDPELPLDALRMSVLANWHGIPTSRCTLLSGNDDLLRGGRADGFRDGDRCRDDDASSPRSIKGNLVIYWRCSNKGETYVSDSAGRGRHGALNINANTEWGQDIMTAVEAIDEWGEKLRPNYSIVCPQKDSYVSYPGDAHTGMSEWTAELYIKTHSVHSKECTLFGHGNTFFLRHERDLGWHTPHGRLRAVSSVTCSSSVPAAAGAGSVGAAPAGSTGDNEEEDGGFFFDSEWHYVFIRYTGSTTTSTKKKLELGSLNGVLFEATDVPSAPIEALSSIRFGGQCDISEIRLWNTKKELPMLLEYAERPLIGDLIAEGEKKKKPWKTKIRGFTKKDLDQRNTLGSNLEPHLLGMLSKLLPPPPLVADASMRSPEGSPRMRRGSLSPPSPQAAPATAAGRYSWSSSPSTSSINATLRSRGREGGGEGGDPSHQRRPIAWSPELSHENVSLPISPHGINIHESPVGGVSPVPLGISCTTTVATSTGFDIVSGMPGGTGSISVPSSVGSRGGALAGSPQTTPSTSFGGIPFPPACKKHSSLPDALYLLTRELGAKGSGSPSSPTRRIGGMHGRNRKTTTTTNRNLPPIIEGDEPQHKQWMNTISGRFSFVPNSRSEKSSFVYSHLSAELEGKDMCATTSEAFREMISGQFHRAEQLLGAIDIRGRWVYQAALKLLREEEEAVDLVVQAKRACTLLRLPLRTPHQLILRRRALARCAMAGAFLCGFRIAEMLLIDGEVDAEIRSAFRALKAKQHGHGSVVRNFSLCGNCPRCNEPMPINPFEKVCGACGCETVFDAKKMSLVDRSKAQRCARCGFVESILARRKDCSFCGTRVEEEIVIQWY